MDRVRGESHRPTVRTARPSRSAAQAGNLTRALTAIPHGTQEGMRPHLPDRTASRQERRAVDHTNMPMTHGLIRRRPGSR